TLSHVCPPWKLTQKALTQKAWQIDCRSSGDHAQHTKQVLRAGLKRFVGVVDRRWIHEFGLWIWDGWWRRAIVGGASLAGVVAWGVKLFRGSSHPHNRTV